jgi:hypothetical protein
LGSGVCVRGGAPRLLHTTLARNQGGNGTGVYAFTNSGIVDSVVAMTNTIVVSHSTGIMAATNNTVTLNGVLWYSNTANAEGGYIIAANAITGNPAFASDGYHLTSQSAAVDTGVVAGVANDIDSGSRPIGRPDLGADEWGARVFLPIVLKQ